MWQIAALLLEASARDALGEREAAGRALERGLDLAEPDGLLFPFLVHPVPELLERQARQRTAHPALIRKVISTVGGRTPAAPAADPPQPLPEPISQAEARVLRLDPDQILDLPLDSARWQIGGQSSQLTTGTGRQRSPYAVIQLSRGEPAFARGGCQCLDSPIPIRMRHPQLRPRILVWRAASRPGITCHDFILVARAAPGNGGRAYPRRTAT